jgi:threonine/homoserine/homoserine lactone efflux protein
MAVAHTLLLLALAHIFAVISPGPNAALILQTAARDRRDALFVVAGLWPAGLIYAVAGLAGLGALLAAAPWLTLIMRIACGGYLCWLGARMFVTQRHPITESDAPLRAHFFWRGFITNLTNPKSIVYWASVFAATGAYELPVWAQAVAVLFMPALGSLWYGSLALLASSKAAQRTLAKVGRIIDRVSGAVMIGFGVKLLAQG